MNTEKNIMKIRLIRYKEFDAFMNMALDEAISDMVRDNKSPPTIRLYGWVPKAVSIGYFQGIKNEVDIEACKVSSVDIVRRRTGGGAVYHDDEITYSLIGFEKDFPKDIIGSYEHICGFIIDALKEIGIVARFSPINDLIVGERKISGNAQTRRQGIILQHGTILYSVDVEKMFSLLIVGKEKISDKLIQSVKKRVTSVSEESQASKEDLLYALERSISKRFDVEIGDYSDEELRHAKKISKERYSTDEWNNMR